MKIIDNTPVEKYEVKGKTVWVKREDLSCPPPGPPFSKMRGLIKVLEKLKQKGYKTIGYTETSISMAGWGVAYGCFLLNLKCVLFDPQYIETPALLKYHRRQWQKFNPTIIPVKAGRAKVNWYISKKILAQYDNAYLLPLGLPFLETIEETAAEVKRTRESNQVDHESIVVNIGSGTIAAGVLKGYPDKFVFGIMGRSGDIAAKRKSIVQKSGLSGRLLGQPFSLQVFDLGWEYTQKSEQSCPFPCHPYYDLKAFQWLLENINELVHPVLFWNIGRIK